MKITFLAHTHTFLFSLKLNECVCVLCVFLSSTSQHILNFSSQNLDNYLVFSMISLQFSIINISFLSGGIYNFTPTPQRSERGRKRRERESGLKDWSLTNSLGYFDVTLTWFLRMYVLEEFER